MVNRRQQRDNIVFGQDFDEDRYWRAVEVASLLPDLQVLPDGDLTEVIQSEPSLDK
jgi:ATP-binding cassette, subfamily C (CFTR/MRP), member 1